MCVYRRTFTGDAFGKPPKGKELENYKDANLGRGRNFFSVQISEFSHFPWSKNLF